MIPVEEEVVEALEDQVTQDELMAEDGALADLEPETEDEVAAEVAAPAETEDSTATAAADEEKLAE